MDAAPELRMGWEWGTPCLSVSLPLPVQGSPAGACVHRRSIVVLTIFSRFCSVGGSLWAGWLGVLPGSLHFPKLLVQPLQL